MGYRISNTESEKLILIDGELAERLCETVELKAGLEYDADFTCYYGNGWSILGAQFFTADALSIALDCREVRDLLNRSK